MIDEREEVSSDSSALSRTKHEHVFRCRHGSRDAEFATQASDSHGFTQPLRFWLMSLTVNLFVFTQMNGWLRPSISDNDIHFHSLFVLLILLLKNVPVVVDRSANFLIDTAGGIILGGP